MKTVYHDVVISKKVCIYNTFIVNSNCKQNISSDAV